jgi:urate oxidase
MIELAENRYGKSRVRLMKVTRSPKGNELREWTVQVLLTGDFDSAHYDGDNSKILPTDTMKNTVYSVARKSSAIAMEDYARELVDFLLSRNPQVTSASVAIEGTMWKRLTIDGRPHPTSFIRGSGELQTTTVSRSRDGAFSIVSGLRNLVVMKTADSGFEDYIVDELTTLKPTDDRLFCTAVTAEWTYTVATLGFDAMRAANPCRRPSTQWARVRWNVSSRPPKSRSPCLTSIASWSTSPASARTIPTKSSCPPTSPPATSRPASVAKPNLVSRTHRTSAFSLEGVAV